MPQPQLTPQSSSPTDFSAFNQGTNRIVTSTYDTSGNQTTDALNRTFAYDAENRQTSFNVTGGQYSYDGDGRRVKKIDSSGTTIFVYNVAGQLIAEYTAATAPTGDTSYLTTDHLGSTRLVTDSGGNVKARYDYLPFGEEIAGNIGGRLSAMGYGGADSTKQKFTQKERDSESGLDYFPARYYSSAQGRFTSADPLFIELRRLGDPQQLNLYTYTRDNPMTLVDASGLDITVTGTEQIERAWEDLERR